MACDMASTRFRVSSSSPDEDTRSSRRATAPRGHRYAVMACYKSAINDSIGYHAWPFHHTKPWHRIFDHATPEQLACFGVHPPGHPFWTSTTLARAQVRSAEMRMS